MKCLEAVVCFGVWGAVGYLAANHPILGVSLLAGMLYINVKELNRVG